MRLIITLKIASQSKPKELSLDACNEQIDQLSTDFLIPTLTFLSDRWQQLTEKEPGLVNESKSIKATAKKLLKNQEMVMDQRRIACLMYLQTETARILSILARSLSADEASKLETTMTNYLRTCLKTLRSFARLLAQICGQEYKISDAQKSYEKMTAAAQKTLTDSIIPASTKNTQCLLLIQHGLQDFYTQIIEAKHLRFEVTPALPSPPKTPAPNRFPFEYNGYSTMLVEIPMPLEDNASQLFSIPAAQIPQALCSAYSEPVFRTQMIRSLLYFLKTGHIAPPLQPRLNAWLEEQQDCLRSLMALNEEIKKSSALTLKELLSIYQTGQLDTRPVLCGLVSQLKTHLTAFNQTLYAFFENRSVFENAVEIVYTPIAASLGADSAPWSAPWLEFVLSDTAPLPHLTVALACATRKNLVILGQEPTTTLQTEKLSASFNPQWRTCYVLERAPGHYHKLIPEDPCVMTIETAHSDQQETVEALQQALDTIKHSIEETAREKKIQEETLRRQTEALQKIAQEDAELKKRLEETETRETRRFELERTKKQHAALLSKDVPLFVATRAQYDALAKQIEQTEPWTEAKCFTHLTDCFLLLSAWRRLDPDAKIPTVNEHLINTLQLTVSPLQKLLTQLKQLSAPYRHTELAATALEKSLEQTFHVQQVCIQIVQLFETNYPPRLLSAIHVNTAIALIRIYETCKRIELEATNPQNAFWKSLQEATQKYKMRCVTPHMSNPIGPFDVTRNEIEIVTGNLLLFESLSQMKTPIPDFARDGYQIFHTMTQQIIETIQARLTALITAVINSLFPTDLESPAYCLAAYHRHFSHEGYIRIIILEALFNNTKHASVIETLCRSLIVHATPETRHHCSALEHFVTPLFQPVIDMHQNLLTVTVKKKYAFLLAWQAACDEPTATACANAFACFRALPILIVLVPFKEWHTEIITPVVKKLSDPKKTIKSSASKIVLISYQIESVCRHTRHHLEETERQAIAAIKISEMNAWLLNTLKQMPIKHKIPITEETVATILLVLTKDGLIKDGFVTKQLNDSELGGIFLGLTEALKLELNTLLIYRDVLKTFSQKFYSPPVVHRQSVPLIPFERKINSTVETIYMDFFNKKTSGLAPAVIKVTIYWLWQKKFLDQDGAPLTIKPIPSPEALSADLANALHDPAPLSLMTFMDTPPITLEAPQLTTLVDAIIAFLTNPPETRDIVDDYIDYLAERYPFAAFVTPETLWKNQDYFDTLCSDDETLSYLQISRESLLKTRITALKSDQEACDRLKSLTAPFRGSREWLNTTLRIYLSSLNKIASCFTAKLAFQAPSKTFDEIWNGRVVMVKGEVLAGSSGNTLPRTLVLELRKTKENNSAIICHQEITSFGLKWATQNFLSHHPAVRGSFMRPLLSLNKPSDISADHPESILLSVLTKWYPLTALAEPQISEPAPVDVIPECLLTETSILKLEKPAEWLEMTTIQRKYMLLPQLETLLEYQTQQQQIFLQIFDNTVFQPFKARFLTAATTASLWLEQICNQRESMTQNFIVCIEQLINLESITEDMVKDVDPSVSMKQNFALTLAIRRQSTKPSPSHSHSHSHSESESESESDDESKSEVQTLRIKAAVAKITAHGISMAKFIESQQLNQETCIAFLNNHSPELIENLETLFRKKPERIVAQPPPPPPPPPMAMGSTPPPPPVEYTANMRLTFLVTIHRQHLALLSALTKTQKEIAARRSLALELKKQLALTKKSIMSDILTSEIFFEDIVSHLSEVKLVIAPATLRESKCLFESSLQDYLPAQADIASAFTMACRIRFTSDDFEAQTAPLSAVRFVPKNPDQLIHHPLVASLLPPPSEKHPATMDNIQASISSHCASAQSELVQYFNDLVALTPDKLTPSGTYYVEFFKLLPDTGYERLLNQKLSDLSQNHFSKILTVLRANLSDVFDFPDRINAIFATFYSETAAAVFVKEVFNTLQLSPDAASQKACITQIIAIFKSRIQAYKKTLAEYIKTFKTKYQSLVLLQTTKKTDSPLAAEAYSNGPNPLEIAYMELNSKRLQTEGVSYLERHIKWLKIYLTTVSRPLSEALATEKVFLPIWIEQYPTANTLDYARSAIEADEALRTPFADAAKKYCETFRQCHKIADPQYMEALNLLWEQYEDRWQLLYNTSLSLTEFLLGLHVPYGLCAPITEKIRLLTDPPPAAEHASTLTPFKLSVACSLEKSPEKVLEEGASALTQSMILLPASPDVYATPIRVPHAPSLPRSGQRELVTIVSSPDSPEKYFTPKNSPSPLRAYYRSKQETSGMPGPPIPLDLSPDTKADTLKR